MNLPMPFDNPSTYPGHSGVDFPQPKGTPIRASGPGVVKRVSYSPSGGYWTVIDYDGMSPLVGYAHQDAPVTVVRAGDRVHAGQIIGYVGKLGKRSTGNHLHMEILGRATYAAVWDYFDADRVVGAPAPASTDPKAAPAKDATITITVKSQEDDMKLLFVTDSVDGNNIPGWALLNTRTGGLVTLRADNPDNQSRANGWARVWGDAKSCNRQDMLNAVDAIQQTA